MTISKILKMTSVIPLNLNITACLNPYRLLITDKLFVAMKKVILFILLLTGCFSFSVFAQDEDPVKREKMMREVQEFKMKYLAQEMDLSELQKKEFFELYSEMSESKKECYHEAVKMDRQLKGDKNASEEEYQQVRNAFNQANSNWAAIQQEYDAKFAQFLSEKQLYKMKEAESNFRQKLQEMKHKRKKDHH